MKTLITILFALAVLSCEKEPVYLLDVDIPTNKFTDDRDNQTYKTITIGDQTWMAENLRYMPAQSSSYHDTEYGVLYSWIAALNSCPKGWHIPTEDEWIELIEYLVDSVGFKLKDGGFKALYGGWYQDEYSSEGRVGAWWTATECFDRYAWVYFVNNSNDDILKTNLPKSCKLTVRCIKD